MALTALLASLPAAHVPPRVSMKARIWLATVLKRVGALNR